MECPNKRESDLWICEYYGKLEACTSLEAEIWGIYKGLTIAYEKEFKDFTVETDSSEAVVLMKEGPSLRTPLRSLVEDSKYMLQRCNETIQHVMREGNRCADCLANMEADQVEVFAVLNDAPDDIKGRFVAEMLRVEYHRP